MALHSTPGSTSSPPTSAKRGNEDRPAPAPAKAASRQGPREAPGAPWASAPGVPRAIRTRMMARASMRKNPLNEAQASARTAPPRVSGAAPASAVRGGAAAAAAAAPMGPRARRARRGPREGAAAVGDDAGDEALSMDDLGRVRSGARPGDSGASRTDVRVKQVTQQQDMALSMRRGPAAAAQRRAAAAASWRALAARQRPGARPTVRRGAERRAVGALFQPRLHTHSRLRLSKALPLSN